MRRALLARKFFCLSNKDRRAMARRVFYTGRMMQLAEHDAAAVHAVPLPRTRWGLFLDVDGRLLELAEHPQAVDVGPRLAPLLDRLRRAADGALALVSGR